jgi:hypothetical protein
VTEPPLGAAMSAVTVKLLEAVRPAPECAVTVCEPERSPKAYVASYGLAESSWPAGKETLSIPDSASLVVAEMS